MDMSWLFNTPIAHRGLWDVNTPENSLGAYKNAIAIGMNIEIDVHLLPDGDFAVFHDGNLKRVCGEDIKVNTINSSELKNHKLMTKSGVVTDYYIPTLREVLDLVDGQVGLLIEMKDISNKNDSCKKLAEYLKDYKGNYAMQSFGGWAMAWWRKHTTGIPVGILSTFPLSAMLPCWQRSVKPDFLSYDIRRLPDWYITRRQKKGTPLLAWTIRTEELYNKCKEVGVDNVIYETIRPTEYKK